MKILVAIANYGTKNQKYLDKLIKEYQSMPYQVDIVILSNIPKNLGSDIEVVVGLPSKNPWSLPFGHKQLFANRHDDYDLFIYSEDDTLITERNIEAFIDVTTMLPEDKIAGFIRYELDQHGDKYFTTIHSHFHWIPDSVESVEKNGKYSFARFSNDHSACYILTREQLKRAINSGGYLVEPHEGRYDLLVTAATDPYTQCGFKKVICISHLENFMLHHLPNAYKGKMGIYGHELELQLKALMEIYEGRKPSGLLFDTETRLQETTWNKEYYEPCRYDIISVVPNDAQNILSVGCGWGLTEAHLIKRGKRVVGIPLDAVIGSSAESRGVEITVPDFIMARKVLDKEFFDCIIMSNVIHHLSNPIEILSSYSELLESNGSMIVSVPNFNYISLFKNKLFNKNDLRKENISIGNFQKSGFHYATRKKVNKWFRESGLKTADTSMVVTGRYKKLSRIFPILFNELLAPNIIFIANKAT